MRHFPPNSLDSKGGKERERHVDGSISWLIPILLFALFYYRYRSKAKQMVRVFDALFELIDKYGDSNDKEAYSELLNKYRHGNGRFFKANTATLQMLRRDAKLFISEHFAHREDAMATYRVSIGNIIEK